MVVTWGQQEGVRKGLDRACEAREGFYRARGDIDCCRDLLCVAPHPSDSPLSPQKQTISHLSFPTFAHTWYMESSLTVAMILRVTVRNLDWYSFTRLASSNVSARPSDACIGRITG